MGFSKILIANRGEIAVRIAATARKLGYQTVAIYSEADCGAPHVMACDEAVAVGPPAVSESYLNMAAILDAAKRTGAQAIHPGYGFLSENADFARACVEADLIFIGPNSKAIDLMGNKRTAQKLAHVAKVPTIPGYRGEDQSDETLSKQALDMGLPVMVKAAAGGGGRGMRLVSEEAQLRDAIRSARSEAENAFGNGELLLEKALLDARHIEIQILADEHGHCVSLGERDCSVQRRHQKVLEEAPGPSVGPELRKQMGDAAVRVAKAVNYCGAGTVEFLVDGEGHFYFLEMNTRLQVEHGVTELVTGLDLVALQLRIAQGENLSNELTDCPHRGHAIEVRLYAEDPKHHFLPCTGQVQKWLPPRGLRVDAALDEGLVISPFYDPMLAKIMAWGETRTVALRKLSSGLEQMRLLGVTHNTAFLHEVLNDPVFVRGEATTAFLDHYESADSDQDVALICLATVLFQRRAAARQSALLRDWFSANPPSFCYKIHDDDTDHDVWLQTHGVNRYELSAKGEDYMFTIDRVEAGEIHFQYNQLSGRADMAWDGDHLHLAWGLRQGIFTDHTHQRSQSGSEAGEGRLQAVMDGRIVSIKVAVGDQVARGQTLLTLEAMKMEHLILADMDGVITGIHATEGGQVSARSLLVEIQADNSQ